MNEAFTILVVVFHVKEVIPLDYAQRADFGFRITCANNSRVPEIETTSPLACCID